MSPPVQFAYYSLWIAHPVLQSAVVGVMVWRKLHKKFRVFFTYLLVEIGTFAIVFPVSLSGNYVAFFFSYWILAAITLVLGFLVIHELFLDIFEPYHTLKDLGTVLFKWASLVLLLVAAVVAASSQNSDQGRLVQAVFIVQRCVRVIQCGLVLFLFVFSKYLGVSWKQHSFGIALGFGTFAGVELIAIGLRVTGSIQEIALSLIIMTVYNVAIATWLAYMSVKQQARALAPSLLASQRWDQSLTDLQHPVAAESLIPMFEQMVDQAFSQKKKEDKESREAPSPMHTSTPLKVPAARPKTPK